MSKKHLQENFYKRLKHLGGVKSTNNPAASLSTSTLVDYTRSNEGIALGIVKENHNYFIKTSSKKADTLGAEDFAYINGVENKLKYSYTTLAEADKNRNMFIKTLNESTSKQFKRIAITEGENIAKAQNNGDAINAEKAQGEADKGKGGAPLKDTAPEKQPAAVPSTKEISVKTQTSPKTVDDTKSGGKVTITNKQTTAKVVKENFGQEQEETPFPPSEDGAAGEESATPSTPDVAITPQSDAPTNTPDASAPEDNELDAAAAALDSLGAGDTTAAGEESSVTPETPDITSNDNTSDVDQLAGGEDANVKDIEKLTGKVTQKIRSTELTPEMTKGFLKSFITSFEDKLGELDHEDRKELASAILKDKSSDDMGIGDQSVSTEDAEEKEIEETINAHLAEMGITESDVNIEGSAESSDHKPFKDYVKARGYNTERVDEISLMEMVSLVNGYTNECGEINPDAQGIAEFVTPEVAEKIAESGNAIFETLMKPFGEKIKKNKKAYATEAVIPTINENFGEDEEDADDEGGEDNDAENAIFGTEDQNSENEPPIEKPVSVGIAPAADVIAAGVPGVDSSKTVTLDLNNNTISVSMNESTANKLEKIVQKKIQEQLNGKKSPINESKKSELSIMIDKLVNEAIAQRRAAIEKKLLSK